MTVDSHLTDAPLLSTFYGVVPLKDFRLVLFLEELNGLESWGADAGNTYLQTKTKEKSCIADELEFGPFKDCVLTITKDIFGLNASGVS